MHVTRLHSQHLMPKRFGCLSVSHVSQNGTNYLYFPLYFHEGHTGQSGHGSGDSGPKWLARPFFGLLQAFLQLA